MLLKNQTKNNIIRKIFFIAFAVCGIMLLITDIAVSQPHKKPPRTKINNQYVPNELIPIKEKAAVPDTIPADRDVEFDLEVLSKIASMYAYGTAGFDKGGLVVLQVNVDTTGKPYSLAVMESSEKGLGKYAIKAVIKYAKQYKLKPAIKNGKPVEAAEILLPIIIDPSIYGDKK